MLLPSLNRLADKLAGRFFLILEEIRRTFWQRPAVNVSPLALASVFLLGKFVNGSVECGLDEVDSIQAILLVVIAFA